MSSTAVLRTRIDPKRKARVERILERLGMTSSQAINLFFAQIEQRKGIPFRVSLQDDADVLPSLQQVAALWDELDSEDFSNLKKP